MLGKQPLLKLKSEYFYMYAFLGLTRPVTRWEGARLERALAKVACGANKGRRWECRMFWKKYQTRAKCTNQVL